MHCKVHFIFHFVPLFQSLIAQPLNVQRSVEIVTCAVALIKLKLNEQGVSRVCGHHLGSHPRPHKGRLPRFWRHGVRRRGGYGFLDTVSFLDTALSEALHATCVCVCSVYCTIRSLARYNSRLPTLAHTWRNSSWRRRVAI